jgi:hypothetical protein
MELRPTSALFPSRTAVGKLGGTERVAVEVQAEPGTRAFPARLRVGGL